MNIKFDRNGYHLKIFHARNQVITGPVVKPVHYLTTLIMKKLRMGLMALAAVSGIGSAFAFNAPKKHFGATYYSYLDSGVQKWSTSQPAGMCRDGNTVACTITSTSPQADVLAKTNGFPANYTIQNDSENHIYR